MKIAIWNNLPSGGGKRALRAMAEGLISRGHQLESWCPPTACLDFEPLADLMPEHVVNYTKPMRRRRYRLLPGKLGHGRHYMEMDRHTRECAHQIDVGGFDACLIGNCQDFSVPPIGRHLRTPTVHYCQELARTIHEAIFIEEGSQEFGLKAGIKRFVLGYWENWQKCCERADLAAFDLVLVNSCYSRESLLRAHNRESRVCYLGIDADRFKSVTAHGSKTVVGLGALQIHKDPRTAVLAIATIPKTERPELVWIGNEVEKKYLTDIRKLALEKGVKLIFRERITDQELVAELSRAAVMIYTSRLEPFGFAPLEANACGLPVVAIGEGGVRETVRDGFNGVVVSNRNPADIGAAVLGLLRDPKRIRQLGANGREWVAREWTWARCVETLEHALIEVRS
jgi:glycosyltransferase involved in cell wall biosynthesis